MSNNNGNIQEQIIDILAETLDSQSETLVPVSYDEASLESALLESLDSEGGIFDTQNANYDKNQWRNAESATLQLRPPTFKSDYIKAIAVARDVVLKTGESGNVYQCAIVTFSRGLRFVNNLGTFIIDVTNNNAVVKVSYDKTRGLWIRRVPTLGKVNGTYHYNVEATSILVKCLKPTTKGRNHLRENSSEMSERVDKNIIEWRIAEQIRRGKSNKQADTPEASYLSARPSI